MKILYILFLLFYSLSAQTLEWMHNLEEAKKYAKEAKKPIILFLHSRNCYYCPVLVEQVFPDKALQKKLKNNFILLSLDGGTGSDGIEEDVTDQAPERYRTSITPAFFFFGPDEEKLARKGKKHMIIFGYWSAKDLMEWADDAIRRYNKLHAYKYLEQTKEKKE